MAFSLNPADLAVDGLPRWPVEKRRINSFHDTIGKPPSLPSYFTSGASPLLISCNNLQTDAGAGSSYDWYLSQRSDEIASQMWRIVSPPVSPAISGTVSLYFVPAVAAKLLPSVTDYFSSDALAVTAAKCHLYVQRKSDMAIQWVPFTLDPAGVDTAEWDPISPFAKTLFSRGSFSYVGQ